jgi:hypothetical protein
VPQPVQQRVVVEVPQAHPQVAAIAPRAPQPQPGSGWQPPQGGNGTVHEAPQESEAEAEPEMDLSAADGEESGYDENEPGAEPEGASGSVARRFAARREARRRQGDAASLGDRLKGLVAEPHEG